MNDAWDGNPNEVRPTEQAPNGPSVLINGSYLNVETGAPIIETVKRMALDSGFGKFRVFLNGVDVKPSEIGANDAISASDRLEIKPYDVAGI